MEKNNKPVESLARYTVSQSSDRLMLETLRVENMSSDYIDWLQDPAILQYLEIRHAPSQTRESIVKYVQDMFGSENNLMMGIFLKADKKHIGNIKLGPVNWKYRRADIGIIIGDKESWGQGYATEAINSLCQIAFDVIGLNRVQAGAYANNEASLKAFLKADFRQEGVLKNYWILNEKPEDQILLGRLPG